ncbi:E3 ubiquitin/ISG15 ligase TRIM25 [Channa argus]|uniref:E3 ubiquitin/ISG15 ligase TRIM25 n=1 Tax=Channa argus TaxID=215402 RepID=A0A6G1QVU3_CHAAH|nr:E3 ubiquitin/ISG15 ligase TRIM25 [Channa argus]
MCKEDQRAAVKSCLMCMSSYCEAHLKPHQTQKGMKEHELIPPTGNLAEKICTQHKYLQEFFCRQCKVFICWLCTSNQHKGHESVSAKAERLEKQKVLSDLQAENQQRLKTREQELKDMRKTMEGLKHSSDRVHDDTEQMLLELQHSVERLQELLEEALDHATLEKMGQAQEVVDSLEAEIKVLKKRDTEMKDLVNCEDHIHYLQTYESMCTPLESGDLPTVVSNPEASFDAVGDIILALRERVEDLCNQELGKITKQVNDTTLFTLKGSRETNNRPSPTPSRRESQSLSSRTNQDQAPSPTPISREPKNLWSRSSKSHAAPAADKTPTPIQTNPAPAPASSGGFNRMASITSLFRSRRHGTTKATPATMTSSTPSAGGNQWGMVALPETPTEVDPSLFLDSPTSNPVNNVPAFPGLREINIDSIQAPEPRTREEFLEYSVILTLDPNSAHRRLVLSESNTKATLQSVAQPYPDTPQRFDGWTQVMCQSPLYAERCYWEVEWRGRGSSVGVAYGALSRKGSDARSGLGYNAQSWTLELSDTCCSAMHDNEKKDIPVTYSPRVGIYLDLSMGRLVFYSVAENMTHLHTFRANFTQPLYPAFGVGSGVGVGLDFALGQFSSSSDSIKICPM